MPLSEDCRVGKINIEWIYVQQLFRVVIIQGLVIDVIFASVGRALDWLHPPIQDTSCSSGWLELMIPIDRHEWLR
jgi:hypothetical protein